MRTEAQVAELADALGSGPSVLLGRGGSSPLLRTLSLTDFGKKNFLKSFFLAQRNRNARPVEFDRETYRNRTADF